MERRALWVALGAFLWFALAPGTVVGLIPFWLTGWRVEKPFLATPALRVVGAFTILVGLGSLVECFVRFAVKGLGTPAPVAAPTRLVVSGQYLHVRNPMYVSILAVVLGESLVLGSIALFRYAVLLWLVFHLWVVVYEEPTLSSRFGSSFELYRQNVRRWLPRVWPWDA